MLFKKSKIYILAGATGTEIQRRGFKTTLPLWSAKALFEEPNILTGIYKDYIEAGADIITTNTFRTQKRTLNKVGKASEWERINKLAVDIARQAIKETGRKVLLAGSVAPLEDCYRPDLAPSEAEMQTEHKEQIELLASLEIDFLLLETFNSILESEIVCQIAEKSLKPYLISFTLADNGKLHSGEDLTSAVNVVKNYHPQAILVNCLAPNLVNEALMQIQQAVHLPFGAYANGNGAPSNDLGWKFTNTEPIEEYYKFCKTWKNLGAKFIGGCCGTSPEYTKLYSQLK